MTASCGRAISSLASTRPARSGMSTFLGITGLSLNMLGVAFAFFVGFPQPEFRGYALLLESSPSPEALARQKARRKRASYVGLGAMFVGFLLQLVGIAIA